MAGVLVLRPGALGDTLLALPALRALRRRFAGQALLLAAHGAAARLLEEVSEVDHGLPFEHPAMAWLFSPGGPPPDAVLPDVVVAWLRDPERRIAQRLRGLGIASVVVAPSRPEPSDQVHTAEHLLRSLAPLDVSPELDGRPIEVTPEMVDEILVHPGSGSAAKNWPPGRFAAVVAEVERRGRSVRLIVGEADGESAAALESHLGRAVPRLEHLPLPALARSLAGCHAYLGNDSGVSHLAGMAGARAVVLFGPSSPVQWRPLGPSVHVLPFEAETAQIVSALNLST